ncbi:hypothetical protein PG984_000920 [Apiospora sp. TS-2023a]
MMVITNRRTTIHGQPPPPRLQDLDADPRRRARAADLLLEPAVVVLEALQLVRPVLAHRHARHLLVEVAHGAARALELRLRPAQLLRSSYMGSPPSSFVWVATGFRRMLGRGDERACGLEASPIPASVTSTLGSPTALSEKCRGPLRIPAVFKLACLATTGGVPTTDSMLGSRFLVSFLPRFSNFVEFLFSFCSKGIVGAGTGTGTGTGAGAGAVAVAGGNASGSASSDGLLPSRRIFCGGTVQ